MTNSDRQFIDRMKQETGRNVAKESLRCVMCDGHGFSMWEPVCEACGGEGRADEWIYSDCGCRADVDENCDQDCELCFPESVELEAAA